MFTLMLMRHAKSDWSSHTPDIDRPLNDRGRRDAIRMGAYLKRAGLVPDKMVVSAAQRTRETAQLLLNDLAVDEKDIVFDKTLYLADMRTLCDNIELYASENKNLLILAHNPGMDYLVNYLASTAPPLSDSGKLMATCALACFHMESVNALLKPGQAELQSLIRVREIVGTV